MINNRSRRSLATAGFTLIEVLVVIVIISIIISLATITFDSEQQELANEGERLSALMKLASEEAIMNSRELRVIFTSNSYTFDKLVDREWRQFEEGLFRSRNLPEDFSFDMSIGNQAVNLETGGDEAEKRAAVLFLSSGEVTPFELAIRGASDLEIVISNRSGVIKVESER
jgi:general secretion pathway protein H